MLEWALIAAGVLFAAFHSGSETGTYCVNRLRLRLRAEQGQAAARALLDFTRRPRLAISTILIGTNVGVYVATVLSAQKLNELLSGMHAELYSGLLMPPVLLILADIIPKSLFQHHADALMYRVVWPLRASQKLFYAPAVLLRWLGGLPQMLLGKGTAPASRSFSRGAFRFYLSQGAAHGVLVPLECEYFALRGVALLQDTIAKVQERLNERLELYGLLATRYDAQTIHRREVLHRLVEVFGDDVYHTVIPRTVRFPEATTGGVPIIDYAPRSPGARAYRQLALEVLSRWDAA